MSATPRFAEEDGTRTGSGVCRIDWIWTVPLEDARGVTGDFGGLWGGESKSGGRDSWADDCATAFSFPFPFPGFATVCRIVSGVILPAWLGEEGSPIFPFRTASMGFQGD